MLLGSLALVDAGERTLGVRNHGGDLRVQGWMLPVRPGKRHLCSGRAGVCACVSMSLWCGHAWAVFCRKLRWQCLGEEPGHTEWDLFVPCRCWKFSFRILAGVVRPALDWGDRLVLCHEPLWCREALSSMSPSCLSGALQSCPTEPMGGGRDAWEVTQAAGERSLPIPAVPALASDATFFLQSVWS